jgi:hypothetical protein
MNTFFKNNRKSLIIFGALAFMGLIRLQMMDVNAKELMHRIAISESQFENYLVDFGNTEAEVSSAGM